MNARVNTVIEGRVWVVGDSVNTDAMYPGYAMKLTAPEAAKRAPEQPPAPPPRYSPRDRFGNPIELWRWEDMSMAQRRAVYADPAQVAVLEAALAEEAAAMAAQAAADAVASEAGSDPQLTPPSAAPC